jgi:prolycopene isomerase
VTVKVVDGARIGTATATGTSTRPRKSRYDAIVVGAGLGGLSAAAFLARSGQDVLLVERLEGPGGYLHGFRRGPYYFDPAVHAIGATGPGMIVDTWLRALGVRDQVTFAPLPSFYTLFLGERRIDVPYDVARFEQMHAEEFPRSRAGIAAFVDLCRQIKKEWDQVRPGLALEDLAATAGGLPVTLRYRAATLDEVLRELVPDADARMALGAVWPYLAAPPSRLSFLSFAGMLISVLEGGESHCVGGFQQLPDAFVAALEAAGGELVLQQEVTKILVREGRVHGIRLADGGEIEAPVVVSNGDLTRTLEVLVGAEHLPAAYVSRIRKLKPALSAFILYGATRLDVTRWQTAPQVIVAHGPFDHRYVDALRNGVVEGYGVHFPSVMEPGFGAPPGEHLFVSILPAPYDLGRPWRDVKEHYTQAVLAALDRTFTGLVDGLVFAEGSTPLSLERYTLNRGGAQGGWENNPHQTQHRRPANTTPLPGLYIVGHWAHPGSGTIHAMGSGFQAAVQILGLPGPEALLAAVGFSAEARA